MPEQAIYLDDILKTLGWSKGKFEYKKDELIKAGVLMYRYEGRPPKRRICAFESVLKNWMILKSAKKESL